METNSAFLFLKPHVAGSLEVSRLVQDVLRHRGIRIIEEYVIAGKDVDQKMLIDRHYHAIASKATMLKPEDLAVPQNKFREKFSIGWDEVLSSGSVANALDACVRLGVDAGGLDALWVQAVKARRSVKFGSDFYCARLEPQLDGPGAGHAPLYVFNGFFLSMRAKYVAANASIRYYVAEWDAARLSWEAFRADVIGATDPAQASAASIRGRIAARWRSLGLSGAPDIVDNAIHASASPFEALAERQNWLGRVARDDPFGQALIAAGVPQASLDLWVQNPQVAFGTPPRSVPLFAALEGHDSGDCLRLCREIAAAPPSPGVAAAFLGSQDDGDPGPQPVIQSTKSSVIRQLSSQLKSTFDDVDTNGDGHLDAEELAEFLRQGGLSITDKEVAALFTLLDRNRNGVVEFDELVEFVVAELRGGG